MSFITYSYFLNPATYKNFMSFFIRQIYKKCENKSNQIYFKCSSCGFQGRKSGCRVSNRIIIFETKTFSIFFLAIIILEKKMEKDNDRIWQTFVPPTGNTLYLKCNIILSSRNMIDKAHKLFGRWQALKHRQLPPLFEYKISSQKFFSNILEIT